MFPLNKKAMEKVMKQLGMNQENIDAEEVIIKTKRNTIIINNPTVLQINLGNDLLFQITGEVTEKEDKANKVQKFSDEDIKLVMEKTKVGYAAAKKALEKTGDIAEAILLLKST